MDTTDKIPVQSQVLKSSLLRLITDGLPLLISYVDAQHRYQFVNKTHERWFGHTLQDIRGKHAAEVLGQIAYEERRPYLEQALAGQEVQFEARSPEKEGKRGFVYVHYIPDIDAAGKVRGCIVLVTDITEQKEREEQLKQAHDQLDIILQGVADGIVVYNKSRRIIYANETAAHMTGFASVQGMMERPPLGIVSQYEMIDEQGQPFPLEQLPHRRILAGERDVQATIGYYNKAMGLPERWSLVKSSPVFDGNGEVLYAITIIQDITERMLAERRKDEFISMAGHELKTPLTSLKGFTNILQRRLAKQGDEQGLNFLSRMDAQLDNLTRLISELLDISRMQVGKFDLRAAPLDLDALVKETMEDVQAGTSTHQLFLEGSTNARIMGDKERLGQVLINMLTNAINYSPQADKVIVRVSIDQHEQQAMVSVQDFGIGIAEAEQQKIFERFYQVTDPEGSSYSGLGIGLYISYGIVERHHGRMWVESRKGEGATFYVALPLLQG